MRPVGMNPTCARLPQLGLVVVWSRRVHETEHEALDLRPALAAQVKVDSMLGVCSSGGAAAKLHACMAAAVKDWLPLR